MEQNIQTTEPLNERLLLGQLLHLSEDKIYAIAVVVTEGKVRKQKRAPRSWSDIGLEKNAYVVKALDNGKSSHVAFNDHEVLRGNISTNIQPLNRVYVKMMYSLALENFGPERAAQYLKDHERYVREKQERIRREAARHCDDLDVELTTLQDYARAENIEKTSKT